MLLLLETGLLESALAAPAPLEDCSTQTLNHPTMTTRIQTAYNSALSRGLGAFLEKLNSGSILRYIVPPHSELQSQHRGIKCRAHLYLGSRNPCPGEKFRPADYATLGGSLFSL